MSTKKKKDILHIATGITLLISFLFMNWAVFFHSIPLENRELAITVMGMVDGAFVGNMVNYYFGGSIVQEKKHEEELEAKKEQVIITKSVTPEEPKKEGE